MQKLDINLEQQEKIYQSVLSKNARLEIENLKNEVAKQKQLKEQQQPNQSWSESATKQDDSKLSNLSNDLDDIIPPPLKMDARSIKRRDSERSARLAEKLELEKASKLNDEHATDNTDEITTDDNSDEVNLSPNPFCRSQFRRSFMNAVYTQKPHTNIAASYASHAYCGPIDEPMDDDLDDEHCLKSLVNKQSSTQHNANLDAQTSPRQLTMQQRREQLQRLLHSDSSLESDVNNLNDLNQLEPIAIKPPRNKFKLTKDCFSVRETHFVAKPAIIVATPEKSTASTAEERGTNIEQVNQVQKQLAFDLIEPVVAHKPPRGNSRLTKRTPENEQSTLSNESTSDQVNVKDRIKLLEQQSTSDSSSPISLSNSSLNNLKADKAHRMEPINLTNRLRSNSLCEEETSNKAISRKHRSLSGENLSFLNHHHDPEKSLEKSDDFEQNDNRVAEEEVKAVNNPNDQDEEDNGYLTMESKLSSNNEIDEQPISLSPSAEPPPPTAEETKQGEEQPTAQTNFNLPEKVNFDEVFGATKDEPPINSIDTEDDEKSLKSPMNQLGTNQSSSFNKPDSMDYSATIDEEDDNRKTVDDQFAIYSGLNTIKKAPANFKLTSALIGPQSNYKQSQLSHQFAQASGQSHIAEQLNNLQLNSMQPSTSQQALADQQCTYKSQQIVASSLINRGNNLVFVSNPVINPEMMTLNQVYESFDGILYGQQCLPAEENGTKMEATESSQQKDLLQIESNASDCPISPTESSALNEDCKAENVLQTSSSVSQSNAPYYYADLLTEEQRIELNKKNSEDRPPLSSRCGNVGGLTSLSKLSTNKKTTNNQVTNLEQQGDKEDQKNDETAVQIENEQIPETETPFTTPPKLHPQTKELSNSIPSVDKLQSEPHEQQTNLNQNQSNSMSQLCEAEMYGADEDDPVYENVNRLTNSTRSQSSINLTSGHSQTYKADETPEPDEYSNEADMFRRISHNYINQNAKIKPPTVSDELNSNQEMDSRENEDRHVTLNNQQTPNKLNNTTIKNSLNHKTTPIHLRSPTVAGYATMDSEQTVLINDDYKVQQSSNASINANNINGQCTVNKLSWKPNLISHSASNLTKIKPNNLANYPDESDSQTSSLTSSAQSLNQLSRNDNSTDLNPFNVNYYRQQSAPNLLNNLPNNLNNNNNYHGNNLNNNAEKCLANKQLNLNKNINKINNLLNAPMNGQDYVVYENADAERVHLLGKISKFNKLVTRYVQCTIVHVHWTLSNNRHYCR